MKTQLQALINVNKHHISRGYSEAVILMSHRGAEQALPRLRRLLLSESVENQPISASRHSPWERILLPVKRLGGNQRFLSAPASQSLHRLQFFRFFEVLLCFAFAGLCQRQLAAEISLMPDVLVNYYFMPKRARRGRSRIFRNAHKGSRMFEHL